MDTAIQQDMRTKWRDLVETAAVAAIPLTDFIDIARQVYIEHALTASRGNQCHAAKALGEHRNTLGRWLRCQGIDPAQFRPPSRQRVA